MIDSPEAEWAVLTPLVEQAEGVGPDPSRGGRPKMASKVRKGTPISLSNGVSIERVERPEGYAIQFRGAAVNSEMIDKVINHIRYLLEEMKG